MEKNPAPLGMYKSLVNYLSTGVGLLPSTVATKKLMFERQLSLLERPIFKANCKFQGGYHESELPSNLLV